MDTVKRLELIRRNTEEIITEKELVDSIIKNKQMVVYWGTAPTGKPHAGYFFPMLKIADLLRAGFKVKILLADLHAALDNVKWSILEKRYNYYEKLIPLIIKAVGADTKNLKFVKGSDFQLKPEYMYDVLQMSSYASVHDTHKAASEVVKQGDNPRLSGLIYPIMQAIDEQYLGVDCQLGGSDQRKIMVLARENLPRLGYKERIEIIHPLIPSLLGGGKMSSSNEKGKIDLLDDEKTVEEKIKNAEMIAKDTNNGIMAFLKYVIFTVKSDNKEEFVIQRDKKFGGDIKFNNYEELEIEYKAGKIHPLDIKLAVARELNDLLSIFRKNKKILNKLAKEAYS
mgnify:CR=1 FL=1